jgi:hypothetical protein
MSAPAIKPRLPGIVGLAFILGAVVAASSLDQAREMWTSARMRELAQKQADDLVWKLARDTVAAGAAQSADAFRAEYVATAVRRRPLRQALTLTNGAIAALLCLCAGYAMRLRIGGRLWLLQTAAASIAFTCVQIGIESLLAIENAPIFWRYAPAIQGPSGIALPSDPQIWRALVVAPPVLVGAVKIAFLAYLIAVLRRPAVRALYGGGGAA